MVTVVGSQTRGLKFEPVTPVNLSGVEMFTIVSVVIEHKLEPKMVNVK